MEQKSIQNEAYQSTTKQLTKHQTTLSKEKKTSPRHRMLSPPLSSPLYHGAELQIFHKKRRQHSFF